MGEVSATTVWQLFPNNQQDLGHTCMQNHPLTVGSLLVWLVAVWVSHWLDMPAFCLCTAKLHFRPPFHLSPAVSACQVKENASEAVSSIIQELTNIPAGPVLATSDGQGAAQAMKAAPQQPTEVIDLTD